VNDYLGKPIMIEFVALCGLHPRQRMVFRRHEFRGWLKREREVENEKTKGDGRVFSDGTF
jgi:hypothetical protein